MKRRLAPIKLLLLDVDGVLTDGALYYSEGDEEMKRFDIKDGMGIDLLKRAGIDVGILTGRTSKMVERRARELGMSVLKQGFYDKSAGFEEVVREQGLAEREIAYMGDDILDLAVLRRAGFAACPGDAADEVRAEVHFVCDRDGGRGAVREVADLILKVRGLKSRAVGEATAPGVKPARRIEP
ncbi:MAG: HAD family hydrolase [Acidobacteria bacterium]|nr:HAD family hydrolase [Acidobacteriota bacterium]